MATAGHDAAPSVWFDLNGRRVTAPKAGQILIQRGADGKLRKVLHN